MAQSPMGNVVPLGDHPRARARLSKKESADMVADCRQLALDRMRKALSGMLDRVEDDLFELADKALDRESQNAYLDARAQARDKRVAIEATFGQHFVDFFDRKVRGEDPPRAKSEDGELALVGNEDLEETIAVREMSRKLNAACEGELIALSQRIGFLLEKPELADDANPFSPATVCAALKDACDQIQAGFKVRMMLLHQLEQYVEGDLHSIYHDLNSHLVARSILPEVRAGMRRVVMPPSAPRRPKAARAPAAQGVPAATPAGGESDILAALAQLLGNGTQTRPLGPGLTGPALGGVQGAWPTAPGSAGGAPSVPPSFVSELTRMHRETGAAVADDAALQNVVRRIKSAPQSATLGTVDAMTIDIVAMLFDYIFDDRHIPSSVKALLGRLQIPVLKVALLDKSFFSSKAHPARRLLDLLAESAIGLDESSARAHPALELIEQVVDRVLADFETDVALFESLVPRVAAFIEERNNAETEIVERSARLVEERERDEIARLAAQEEVDRCLAAHARVPAPVRDMLGETWVRALTRVHRAEGENSPAWQSLAMTMEELLWSVEPKSSPDDRKRLITMLPGMLKLLQAGLERGEMDEPRRDAFLGTLVDCHAVAVKAGLRGLAALPVAPAPEPKPQRPAIERAMVPAGDIQVEEIRLRAPKGAAAVRNVFTRTGIWTNLQRGTWLEFGHANSSGTRARLTWISPNKGVYLFTNPLSTGAVSISPEALAEQMRLGEARIIDDASLVDRAVDTMLANLREAQG
jgi:hypothetical protein